MKKFFIYILCSLVMVTLIGCATQNSHKGNESESENDSENYVVTKETENETTESNKTESNPQNDAVTNATDDGTTEENETESDPPNDTVTTETGNGEHEGDASIIPAPGFIASDENYVVSANMNYFNFDDACKLATDVVVATFTGNRPYGASFTEYSFNVKSRILGNAPDQINVYTSDVTVFVENESVGSYNEQELFLEHNTDYLLVLDHRVSVYNEVDIYQFVCNIAIDISNISNSTMYNQPILTHSTHVDFANTTASSILEYVGNLVADNTPSAQPAKNPSIETILAASTDVLVIQVDECVKTVVTDFRNTGFYSCTVLDALKGSILENEIITVLFRNEDISVGDQIIVALNNDDNATYYRLTSQNSIVDVSDRAEIESLLDTHES